jgi:YbbR domain-containing protein
MWSRVRDILLHNLGLKFASLVLALLLYAHVVTDQVKEETVAIPVSLVGLPDTLAVVGQPPASVEVRFRGRWKDLIRLGLRSHSLQVDLADAKPGQFQQRITAEDVTQKAIPPEMTKLLTVTEVLEPRTVDVEIQARASKTVLVTPRVVGTPVPGYRLLGPPEAEPDSALLTGPASILAETDTLYTLPIDITGEREKIQRQVDLDLGPYLLAAVPRQCLVTLRFARAVADSSARPR